MIAAIVGIGIVAAFTHKLPKEEDRRCASVADLQKAADIADRMAPGLVTEEKPLRLYKIDERGCARFFNAEGVMVLPPAPQP